MKEYKEKKHYWLARPLSPIQLLTWACFLAIVADYASDTFSKASKMADFMGCRISSSIANLQWDTHHRICKYPWIKSSGWWMEW